jgi:hypothetical protein
VPGASSTKQELQHENDSGFDDVRFSYGSNGTTQILSNGAGGFNIFGR